jgi:hypothetical protein
MTILQIEAGLLQNKYVAKVIGVFPNGEVLTYIEIIC